MRGPVPISKPAQQKNKCKRAVPKKSGTVPSANLDLETLDFAFYIGSTPTFLYFDFYLAQVMILLVFCQVPMYNHLNIVRFFLFYIFILCLWILLLYNYKYTLLLPKYGPINSRFIALRATKRILRSSRDCDEIERLETLIFKFNSMHQPFSYFLRTVVNFADNMVL